MTTNQDNPGKSFKPLVSYQTKYEKLRTRGKTSRTTFRIADNQVEPLDEIVKWRTIVDMFLEIEKILKDEKQRNSIFTEECIKSIQDSKIDGSQRSFQPRTSSHNTLAKYSKQIGVSRDQLLGFFIGYLENRLEENEKALNRLILELTKTREHLDHILDDALETLSPGHKFMSILIDACEELDNIVMKVAYALDTGEDISEEEE